MSDVTRHSKKEEIRAKLERAIEELSLNGLPSLSEAFKSVLVAIDYNDAELINSHTNTALEEVREFVQWVIRQWHEGLGRSHEPFRDLWKLMTENPRENYDDLRSVVEEGLNEALGQRAKLRDGLVRDLQSRGYEVANAAQFEDDIEELQKFKRELLDNWPLSSQPLPSVNREMVAASRARRARGEHGEPIADLIRRLGGEPTTNP